jgi:hypothetical protein
MKIFTTGLHAPLPRRILTDLGLPPHVQQGRVLTTATTKAAAYQLLAERDMAPGSIRADGFRRASGDDVDALTRAGLLDAPVVLAMGKDGPTEVVRVEPDSTVLLGYLERAPRTRFIPAPAGVAGPVWTQPVPFPHMVRIVASRYRVSTADALDLLDDAVRGVSDGPVLDNTNRVLPGMVPVVLRAIEDELEQRELRQESADIAAAKTTTADLVLMALATNKKRVDEVNAELKKLRGEQQELAHHARDLGIIPGAAQALGVSPGRVSQLGDEYLVAKTRAGRR